MTIVVATVSSEQLAGAAGVARGTGVADMVSGVGVPGEAGAVNADAAGMHG